MAGSIHTKLLTAQGQRAAGGGLWRRLYNLPTLWRRRNGGVTVGSVQIAPSSGTVNHPLLGPVRYKTREIGWDPDNQVISTIGVMRQDVEEDSKDPWFNSRAQGMLSGMDERSQVAAVHAHTKGSIRFQRDETTGEGIGNATPTDPLVEVIIRPVDMARYVEQGNAVGDCDDFSMYAAAMLEAVGIPCAFVTVAADNRDPNQYSHVYVAAYPHDDAGRRVRIPIDCSHGEYPGWEVPNRFGKRAEWPVEGGGLLGVIALGAAAWWLVKEMAQ